MTTPGADGTQVGGGNTSSSACCPSGHRTRARRLTQGDPLSSLSLASRVAVFYIAMAFGLSLAVNAWVLCVQPSPNKLAGPAQLTDSPPLLPRSLPRCLPYLAPFSSFARPSIGYPGRRPHPPRLQLPLHGLALQPGRHAWPRARWRHHAPPRRLPRPRAASGRYLRSGSD